MFEKKNLKRFCIMLIGNGFLGIGISLFKLSGLGNDPWSAMLMGVSDAIGVKYANFSVAVNIGLFILQFFLGRHLIGAGTIVNGIGLGYIVTFFYQIWLASLPAAEMFLLRLVYMAVGMVITGFGLFLYQDANMGVAPYDSLALIMSERWKKIPYFWNRMLTDGICTLICWISGGLIGLGTLVTVFALGPFVSMFRRCLGKRLTKG